MAEEKEIDIRRFLRGTKRMWWIFAISMIFFITVGIAYWVCSMPVFISNSTILIEDDSNSGGGGGMMSLMKTFSIGGFGSSSVDNEIVLINSNDVFLRTVKELELNREYILRRGLAKEMLYKDTPIKLEAPQSMMDTLSKAMKIQVDINGPKADIKVNRGRFSRTITEMHGVTLPTTVKTPYGSFQIVRTDKYTGETCRVDIILMGYEAAAQFLREEVTIAAASKISSAIELSYECGSKQMGQDVLNCIMGIYNDKRLRRKHTSANEQMEFLDKRINELSAIISTGQQEMADYKQRYNLMGIEQQAQILAESTEKNRSEAVKLQAQELYYEELLRSLRNPSKADALLPVFSGEAYNMIKDYNDLLLRKKELERTAKSNNTALNSLSDQVAEMRITVIDNINGLLRSAQLANKENTNLINQAYGRLHSLPVYEKEYLTLFRDQQIENELYLFLIEKRESALLQLYSQNTLGFVIDEAYSGIKPINTKKILVLAVCILLGILVPILIIIWRMHHGLNRIYSGMDVAFIDVEKHTVDSNSTPESSAEMRTLLTEHSRKHIYIGCFGDCEEEVKLLYRAYEDIGSSIREITCSELHLPLNNDSLLRPEFQDSINDSISKETVTFIRVPEPKNSYELISEINASESCILLIVHSGSISRPDVKKYLRGIRTDHIYLIIIHNN